MTAPTDTPITDEACKENGHPTKFVFADDMRKLERTLAAAREEAEELARRVVVIFREELCDSLIGDAPPPTVSKIIARVRVEMEKKRAQYKHAEYGYHLREENGTIRIKPVGHSSEKEKGNG